MMQATEPGTGDHGRSRRSLACHWSPSRGVLIERIVNPVVVMIVHVIANEPAQMLFVQSDNMVENLPAAASHPAFRGPVGEGRQLHRMTTMAIPLLKSSTHTIR